MNEAAKKAAPHKCFKTPRLPRIRCNFFNMLLFFSYV